MCGLFAVLSWLLMATIVASVTEPIPLTWENTFLENQGARDAVISPDGKAFESKSYPGEPHGFRNPQNRIDTYQRLEAFFDKYLK